MAAKQGVTVKDVNAADFIKAYGEHLQKSRKMTPPEWAEWCKGGVHKELGPYESNFWFVRAAAIARRIYLKPSTSVLDLTRAFGGKKRQGARAPCHAVGTDHIPRLIMQQLEKMQVIEKNPSGGRRISKVGRRDLDRIAGQIVAKRIAAATKVQ